MECDSVLGQQSISGKNVSLILCVWKPCYVKSGVTVICVSPSFVFPRTHITRDPCFPAHISLGMRVSPTKALVIYVSLPVS